jgi:hypothetical protein
MRVLLALCVASLTTCATGSGAVGNAVVGSAVALGASAVSRASGDCFANCPDGTACNRATGLCDTLPCRGKCSPFEECVP